MRKRPVEPGVSFVDDRRESVLLGVDRLRRRFVGHLRRGAARIAAELIAQATAYFVIVEAAIVA
jgi:hypothetical protein